MPSEKDYDALPGGNVLTQKQVKNISASVRQRLLNKCRTDARPFQELAQYYAMERFLYRLAQSRHANRFILKGALMLRIWQAPETRPTMDIDLLGKTDNDVSALIAHIADILSVDVDADGLSFFPENITAEHITEEAEYKGVRICFPAELDTIWNAFMKKIKQDHVPAEFGTIVMQVKTFINPIASALTSRKPPPSKWAAPGPWA